MTNNDKALVEQLEALAVNSEGQDDWLVMSDAADRIEALSEENERLREAFKEPMAWLIADDETSWVTVFEPNPKDHPYCEVIPLYRAALGEQQ